MKSITKFIAVIFFFSICTSLIAQTGKPQYNIRCEREGTLIGNIKIELFPLIAPLHSHNFDSLVSIQFYDTTAFHRVVPNFVIQGGDPNSRHGDPSTWGNGDSTQTNVPAEFSNVNHSRGTLGAARDTDINSANSQFFINVVDNLSLNGAYTVYGRVYEGMDIADNIVNSPTVPGTERPAQKIEMFVTTLGINNATPATPDLVYPPDNFLEAPGTINFQWTTDSEAVLFHLQISTDSTFSTTLVNSYIGTNNRSVTNIPQGLIKYYWRVQANNGGYLSPYSSVGSFTTRIAGPNLITPPDSAVNIPTNPQFEWEPVNGAQSYRIQVATTSLFFGAGLVVNDSEITANTYSTSGLQTNKKHYWRVRGITSTYEGTYSPIRSFTTTATVHVDDKTDKFDYSLKQNFPNPFNPSTSIKYSLQNAQFVTLKIYNVLGSEIATLVNEEKAAGNYEIDFNPAATDLKLTSGIYFYKLTAGSFVETKKMLMLK